MQVHGEAVGGHHAESGAGQHHHAGLHSFGVAGRSGLELGHLSGEVEVVGAAVQAPVDQGCSGAVEGPGAVQKHGDAGETVPHGGRVGQAEGPDGQVEFPADGGESGRVAGGEYRLLAGCYGPAGAESADVAGGAVDQGGVGHDGLLFAPGAVLFTRCPGTASGGRCRTRGRPAAGGCARGPWLRE